MTIAQPLPWLTTARLALREFVPADFEQLYRLDSDPRVMRYLNGGHPLGHAEVRHALARILAHYPHYHGLGIWHASRRDTNEFIGWFCLKYCGRSCDVEVGYRLLPQAWGRGYATEGARALLRHGFETLELDRVIGITHAGNSASQRVLLKCGMAGEGWGRYYDRRVRLFAAHRPASGDVRTSAAGDPLRHVGEFPGLLRHQGRPSLPRGGR